MQVVQVRLLNDGGFGHSEGFEFPLIVNSARIFSKGVLIRVDELIKLGFNFNIVGDTTEDLELFFSARYGECEVLS